ncbi:helix-turn-helix domain-containing protein [Paraburkholderia silviterrae]|uniref:XRE family transcriptional regulator n=1 Tax=Paraburkholderia silviterrae TaxID=2528715 RepID=A0A4R5M5E7_9BURK|nr:helix-turn-helix transcriptional regulator [Paraburkholderia silviterrae]TDG21172.1 XRE family transcriptional regulator [Paraburkholderia silviterrae]
MTGHFVKIAMKPADLSYALARLGWTQATFAEYSGYDRRTISRWISGESAIPLLVDRHLDLLLAIRDRLP